jgi:hypothetical protein
MVPPAFSWASGAETRPHPESRPSGGTRFAGGRILPTMIFSDDWVAIPPAICLPVARGFCSGGLAGGILPFGGRVRAWRARRVSADPSIFSRNVLPGLARRRSREPSPRQPAAAGPCAVLPEKTPPPSGSEWRDSTTGGRIPLAPQGPGKRGKGAWYFQAGPAGPVFGRMFASADGPSTPRPAAGRLQPEAGFRSVPGKRIRDPAGAVLIFSASGRTARIPIRRKDFGTAYPPAFNRYFQPFLPCSYGAAGKGTIQLSLVYCNHSIPKSFTPRHRQRKRGG